MISIASAGSQPWQGQAPGCRPPKHQTHAERRRPAVKITLTVEVSAGLFAALFALAGATATLLASDGGNSLKNPAAAAVLTAGLLFGRLLPGPGPRA